MVEAGSSHNVQIVVLRGSNEDQYGRLLSLVHSTEDATALNTTALNTTGKPINHPSDGRFLYVNCFVDVGDVGNVGNGEQSMRDHLNAQHEACASTEYVLLGCSTGAEAVGDAPDPSGDQLSAG